MPSIPDQTISPKLLLNREFSDISLLGDAIGWDLEFRQLDAGRLKSRALLLAGPRNVVMRVEFNRKFHQRGAPPPGVLSFGFPDPESGPLRWTGTEAKPGALLNFNHGRLEGVNPGNFKGFTLSFTEDLLEEMAIAMGYDASLSSVLHSTSIWNPVDSEHRRLRSLLHGLDQAALYGGEPGVKPLTQTFNDELAASVVAILMQQFERLPDPSARFRSGALKRALERLDDTEQAPLRVNDLCHQVGASLSTLQRAFLEEFGETPQAYMVSKRLSLVRRQLIHAEPGARINEIASRHGFWHMGRFASQYRRKFGELPSQTLNDAHPIESSTERIRV